VTRPKNIECKPRDDFSLSCQVIRGFKYLIGTLSVGPKGTGRDMLNRVVDCYYQGKVDPCGNERLLKRGAWDAIIGFPSEVLIPTKRTMLERCVRGSTVCQVAASRCISGTYYKYALLQNDDHGALSYDKGTCSGSKKFRSSCKSVLSPWTSIIR
jgi:hypothetical protein